MHRLAATILLAASGLFACEAPGARAPGPAAAAARLERGQLSGGRLDKRALYADASLVPSRAGERARRELALAGELSAALELLDLAPVHVDVELRERPAVVVVARFAASEDPARHEATITELALALVPGLEPEGVHPWLRPRAEAEPPPPRRAPLWTLLVACLGLGLSVGVTSERLRARAEARA